MTGIFYRDISTTLSTAYTDTYGEDIPLDPWNLAEEEEGEEASNAAESTESEATICALAH
jgi:hypothetical protein